MVSDTVRADFTTSCTSILSQLCFFNAVLGSNFVFVANLAIYILKSGGNNRDHKIARPKRY